MIDLANPDLLRQAVARANGKCNVCGAPCRDSDARRRIDPGPLGDTADNWSAMCRACRDFLDGKAPAPARYVVHLHDSTRFRRIVRRFWHGGLAALSVAAYAALCGIAGYTLWHGMDSVFESLGAALLILFLLAMAFNVAVFRRRGPPAQRVHHTFEPQVIHVREGR